MLHSILHLSDLKKHLKADAEWNEDLMTLVEELEKLQFQYGHDVTAQVLKIKKATKELIKLEEEINDSELAERLEIMLKSLASVSIQIATMLEMLVDYVPEETRNELKEAFLRHFKDKANKD